MENVKVQAQEKEMEAAFVIKDTMAKLVKVVHQDIMNHTKMTVKLSAHPVTLHAKVHAVDQGQVTVLVVQRAGT